MNPNDKPQLDRPDTIDRLRQAVYPSFAMLAAMKLDLFSRLEDGPLIIEELATAMRVQPEKLSPILYLLVESGLLTVTDGCFANTTEADTFLVHGKPGYIGGAHDLMADLWHAGLKTFDTVSGGKPIAKHDFTTMSEDELAGFFRGLHPGALSAGKQLAESFGLDRRRHLLDVAGGSGGVAIGACMHAPGLTATVVELPTIARIAEGYVTDAGLGDRVKVMAADLIKHVPDGTFDVAIMRFFLQVLSAEQARRALCHVGDVIEPGGEIHILGYILDDTRLAPRGALCLNLVFLNVYDDGQAYTVGEYQAWLNEAGFGKAETVFRPDGVCHIIARKTGPAA